MARRNALARIRIAGCSFANSACNRPQKVWQSKKTVGEAPLRGWEAEAAPTRFLTDNRTEELGGMNTDDLRRLSQDATERAKREAQDAQRRDADLNRKLSRDRYEREWTRAREAVAELETKLRKAASEGTHEVDVYWFNSSKEFPATATALPRHERVRPLLAAAAPGRTRTATALNTLLNPFRPNAPPCL
jgi:hypothetical protein